MSMSDFRSILFRALLALALCVGVGGLSQDSAVEPDWQVGLASVKITPREPIRMAGYGSRKELSEW